MDAILYRSRDTSAVVLEQAERLRSQATGKTVVIATYSQAPLSGLVHDACPVHETFQESLSHLPYPGIVPEIDWHDPIGHNDLPLFDFYLKYSDFDHYWIIEDDVRYTGKWNEIFCELDKSNADLLTTTLQSYADSEHWYWWPTLKHPDDAPPSPDTMHRCFLPFTRASNRMVRAMHEAYSKGWGGHYEAVWATICSLNDFRMEEIGGFGKFTPECRKGRFYMSNANSWCLFPGTFVFRPSFNHNEIEQHGAALTGVPMLWHPVKQPGSSPSAMSTADERP